MIRDFGYNAELDILMASKLVAQYIADPVVNAFGLLVQSKDQALNMKNGMQNQILCMRRVKDEAKEFGSLLCIDIICQLLGSYIYVTLISRMWCSPLRHRSKRIALSTEWN